MEDALHAARKTIRRIFLELGAECMDMDGRTVFTYHGDYFRLDEISFNNKPFFVIECGTREDFLRNRMEDADPFPYDLPEEEIRNEIRFVLEG